MHDYGGGDIPLIMTDWKSEDIDRALDYWVELSKGPSAESQQRCKRLIIIKFDHLIP